MDQTVSSSSSWIPECAICLETCKIPVRLKCFPCRVVSGKPSCHSMTRVCLVCARQYLELNTPRMDRSVWKRCLTCSSSVRLSTLTASNSYTCSYSTEGCLFQGTQSELDVHMQRDCPFRNISCKHCKLFYSYGKQVSHKEICVGHITCSFCPERIPKCELVKHRREVHQMVRCGQCKEWVDENIMMTSHVVECPQRKISCPVCLGMIPLCQITTHAQTEKEILEKESKELIQKLCGITKLIESVEPWVSLSSSSY